jgi:hypothetical protein
LREIITVIEVQLKYGKNKFKVSENEGKELSGIVALSQRLIQVC